MNYLTDVLHAFVQNFVTPAEIAWAIEAAIWLALIALGAWIAVRATNNAIRKAVGGDSSVQQRTYAPIFAGLAKFAIFFIAAFLALGALHVDATTLLASAGVLSVAIGFGAQFLIRDMLAGFSLLWEGIVQVGDIVHIDADTGTVERVTLRILQIRKANGELVTIPNGQVGRIGNLSRDFGVAMVRITVPYRADIGKALDTLRAAAAAWAAEGIEGAVGEPVVNGAVDTQDTGVVIQVSVRVRPGRQWAVEAELRQRVVAALSSAGIPIDSRVSVTL